MGLLIGEAFRQGFLDKLAASMFFHSAFHHIAMSFARCAYCFGELVPRSRLFFGDFEFGLQEGKQIIDESGLEVHSAILLKEAADLVKKVVS